MSITRRKSALMSTILGMESSDSLNDDLELKETDEQMPEELSEDDLSFLEETPGETDSDEDDTEMSIEDIVGCADENGKVKMSSIRALAECGVPDDSDIDDIFGSEDQIEASDNDVEEYKTASNKRSSLTRPGIEDTIGNHCSGGTPSVSTIAPTTEETKIDENEQKDAIKSVTARLDRLANYCERSGHKRLAYRLDVIADKLEQLEQR